MIPAQKNRPFEHLFNVLNRGLLHHHFHSISLKISASQIELERPTVYFVNHSNWWDSLLVFQLNYSFLQQNAFGMMAEKSLREHYFFRRLGVFSINRYSLRDVKQSLDYSIHLLQKPRNSLWIFPQGDVFHQDIRPLSFLPGLGYLFEKCAHVQWVPVTFYFHFGLVRQPDIYIEIGEPLSWAQDQILSRAERLQVAEQVLTKQLDHLRKHLIQGELTDFHPIWQGFRRSPQRYEHILNDRIK